jgi:hypothetical protein
LLVEEEREESKETSERDERFHMSGIYIDDLASLLECTEI